VSETAVPVHTSNKTTQYNAVTTSGSCQMYCMKHCLGIGMQGGVTVSRLIIVNTERLEEFRYLGTTLTDQNSIQEEIKSRLKLGNACYHSVQNLLSSRLLSKNLKIKIYRTIILPVVLYGCETCR